MEPGGKWQIWRYLLMVRDGVGFEEECASLVIMVYIDVFRL